MIEETVEIMKRRAREETTSISKIYSEEIVAVRMKNPGVPTGFYFPSLVPIDSALYRHRAQNYPALPKCLADLVLKEEWSLTKHGERFLLIDESCRSLLFFIWYILLSSDGDEERILMCGSQWSTTFLSYC
jgi:hypothetical protein